MLILNIFAYIFITCFYSMVIIGYGAKFKNLFFQNDKNSIGEFGIYGFIVLYFLSILIHFFSPINFLIKLNPAFILFMFSEPIEIRMKLSQLSP